MLQTECVYCDEGNGSETRDHVPPKALFPSPRPENLVTVPSCFRCNNGAKLDDEYFRLVMAAKAETVDTDADAILETALRGLDRPQATGFSDRILRSMDVESVYSISRIFVGRELVMNADFSRIRKVVERTVRGIFYAEQRTKIPTNYELLVIPFNSCEARNNPHVVKILKLFSSLDVVKIGGNVFSYARKFHDEDSISSFWLLEFFGASTFAVIVRPRIDSNGPLWNEESD